MKGLDQIREDNRYKPIRLFDNQGRTYDRFTLVVTKVNGVQEYFSFSITPDSVVGINQYNGSSKEGYGIGTDTVGKEIELKDAPYAVLSACRVRIHNNRPDLMTDAISRFQEMDRMSQLCDLIDNLELDDIITIRSGCDVILFERVRKYFGIPVYVSDKYMLECIDTYRQSLKYIDAWNKHHSDDDIIK